MADYTNLCNKILENIGGKENISNAVHCMTRLRLSLKDKSKANIDALKEIKGVLGAQFNGDQFHVIIGTTVGDVYKEFCEIAGLNESEVIEENLDIKKEKFNIKEIPRIIMNYLSGSIAPVLTIMLGCGFFQVFYSILGSGLLNVLSEDSAIMQTLNIFGKVGFYFLPVYVAWGAAKKLNTSIPIALVIGTILIDPNIVSIVQAKHAFKIFGFLNMPLNDYSSGVLPPLIAIWVMSYVYKFIDKHMPKSLKVVAVPFFTLLIILPVTLCFLAPIGNWIGVGIAAAINAIYNVAGPVGVGLIGALWMLMISTGMHIAVIQMAIVSIFSNGYDPIVFVGSTVANYALMGLVLAYFIRSKGEEKQLAGANTVAIIAGGVSEPTIFGLLFRNKRAFIYQIIAGGVGGFVAGALKTSFYTMAPSNFMNALGFTGGVGNNFRNGVIACIIGFGLALLLGLILGFEEKKKEA